MRSREFMASPLFGKFLEERADLERPDQVYFDPNEDGVYIAELE